MGRGARDTGYILVGCPVAPGCAATLRNARPVSKVPPPEVAVLGSDGKSAVLVDPGMNFPSGMYGIRLS